MATMNAELLPFKDGEHNSESASTLDRDIATLNESGCSQIFYRSNSRKLNFLYSVTCPSYSPYLPMLRLVGAVEAWKYVRSSLALRPFQDLETNGPAVELSTV